MARKLKFRSTTSLKLRFRSIQSVMPRKNLRSLVSSATNKHAAYLLACPRIPRFHVSILSQFPPPRSVNNRLIYSTFCRAHLPNYDTFRLIGLMSRREKEKERERERGGEGEREGRLRQAAKLELSKLQHSFCNLLQMVRKP